jgi:hypothetical protein
MTDVPRLLGVVNGELETDFAQFAEWDVAMYTNHYRAAHGLDPARAADLRRRYELQLTVQNWIFELMARQSTVSKVLEQASRGNLQAEDFAQLKQILQGAADHLAGVHKEAGRISCPAMQNVPEGKPLSELIGAGDWKAPNFAGESISGGQVAALMTGYGVTVDKLRRMFFKGMGNILLRQERIAADFTAAATPATAVASADLIKT